MDRRAAGPALLVAILLAGCVTAKVLVPSASTAPANTFGPPASATPPRGTPGGIGSAPATAATPAPTSAALDPATVHWTQVASAVTGPVGADLVGFDAGYVVLGSRDPFQEPVASFSADGLAWEVTSLANLIPNCPDWGPPGDENVPDAEVASIATNDRRVVVVGAIQSHVVAGCGGVGAAIEPVAWVSDNGRTWQRSAPFGGAEGGRATSVWAAADGWLAVVDQTAWQSPDGLHWQATRALPGPGPLQASAGPSLDGAHLISVMVGGEGFREARLFRSGAGQGWTPIDLAAGCETGATQLIAPSTSRESPWVVLSDGRICTSFDLIDWVAPKLPIQVWRIAATRFGPIAIGDMCTGAGNDCPDPGWRAYRLAGNGAWSRLEHPEAPFGRSIADGPAGVLLLGSGPADTGPRIWLLEP